MVVLVYPLALGGWSFREQESEPIEIEVPAGSRVAEVKSIGAVLFVPSEGDPLQSMAWFPRGLLAEANRHGSRFRVVGSHIFV